MVHDFIEGKWKQICGQARIWWGKISDNELEKVSGKIDRLFGLFQEKFGYTRQRAEAEDEYKHETQ